jgi:HPt (histidine-containing phosphotransfer) domain-containing protein
MNTLNSPKVMSMTFGPHSSKTFDRSALGVKSEKIAWPSGVRDRRIFAFLDSREVFSRPPVEVPSPGMAAINWDCLRNSTMNDPDLARETVKLFLDQTPVQLARLSELALRPDAESVRRAAHQLKGGCLIVGAGGMAGICEQLEATCEAGSNGGLSPLVEALAQEFTAVKKEVHNGPWEEKPATQAPQPEKGLAE